MKNSDLLMDDSNHHPRNRSRSKSRAKKSQGYQTDIITSKRRIVDEDHDAIDYANLNEEFGDVSVSGMFLLLFKIAPKLD